MFDWNTLTSKQNKQTSNNTISNLPSEPCDVSGTGHNTLLNAVVEFLQQYNVFFNGKTLGHKFRKDNWIIMRRHDNFKWSDPM